MEQAEKRIRGKTGVATSRDACIVEGRYFVMATDGQQKYIHYMDGARDEYFFDLKTNSGEMFNRKEDEKYIIKKKKLKADVCSHMYDRPGVAAI